jgi:hypothetical protein
VVALGDEDLERGAEKLGAALGARHAGAAAAYLVDVVLVGAHAVLLPMVNPVVRGGGARE